MNTDCLIERDLILMHYGEKPEETTLAVATAHLNACAACQARRDRLAAELRRIPAHPDPDPHAATRIVTRVSERLQKQHRRWPVVGGVAAGVVALAMAIFVWLPANQTPTPVTSPTIVSSEQPFVGPPRPIFRQAAFDPDLLEQLDLLEELETLRDIEGV